MTNYTYPVMKFNINSYSISTDLYDLHSLTASTSLYWFNRHVNIIVWGLIAKGPGQLYTTCKKEIVNIYNKETDIHLW